MSNLKSYYYGCAKTVTALASEATAVTTMRCANIYYVVVK